MERRWSLVRGHLQSKGLDALICLGTSDNNNSGNTRWLTDGPGSYRKVVIFYPNDLMTVIEHGPQGATQKFDGAQPGYAGVGELLTVSEFPAVHYSQHYEAERAVETLMQRGAKKVALANPGNMPYGFLATLKERLEGKVTFFDESEFLDNCKALKSAEEIEILKRAAAIQDAAFARVLREAKPGMRDRDISAIAWSEVYNQGATGGIVLIGSAPQGEPARIMAEHMQGRVIEKGDYFNLLIETGDTGGYILEMGRPIVFGKASGALREGFEQVREAQAFTASKLVPGAKCSDIFAAHNQWMTSHGLPPERRIYSHGQGYDLVEQPLIRDDEKVSVQKNMVFAVHPTFATPTLFATVCNDYLVDGANGAVCLHQMQNQIFEL
jgi:Xaa-Pro aminopeptidase